MASILYHRTDRDGNIGGGERDEWSELTRDISAKMEGVTEEKQERGQNERERWWRSPKTQTHHTKRAPCMLVINNILMKMAELYCERRTQ